jgi:hypothetical protein
MANWGRKHSGIAAHAGQRAKKCARAQPVLSANAILAGMENPASHPGNEPDKALETLQAELSGLIAEARTRTAITVNSELTQLYWRIGKRVREQVLQGQRAAYGWHVIEELGRHLSAEFGRGFEGKNLRRMVQFAEVLRKNRAYRASPKERIGAAPALSPVGGAGAVGGEARVVRVGLTGNKSET